MTCFVVRCKVFDDKEHEAEYEEITESEYSKEKFTGVKAYMAKHGKHFTNELAEYASSLMKNGNDTEHMWTCELVKLLLSEEDYGKLTLGDMTYLANMAYADFYPTVIPYEELCIKYAIAIAHDKDGYEGVAFTRWSSDVMAKKINFDWEKFI